VTLPKGKVTTTQLSETVFREVVFQELKEVSSRFAHHTWIKALQLVRSPMAGSSISSSIIPLHSPLMLNELEWWTELSKDHGYGMFHGRTWDQTHQSYTLVCDFLICTQVKLTATGIRYHLDMLPFNMLSGGLHLE
jgi:hypothetical protein